MTLRKITIGLSPYSDILLDDRCVYASFCHGVIYSDGNQLYYQDMSTNGTIINRLRVRHRCVLLYRGDIILIAGRYLLDWNQIDVLLPKPSYNNGVSPMTTSNSLVFKKNVEATVVNKWNWGAMGLYPVWGLFNGCKWAVMVALVSGALFPIPNLFFGYYGNRLALYGKQWSSFEYFQYKQMQWRIPGFIIMFLLTLVFIWWFSVYVGFLFMEK